MREIDRAGHSAEKVSLLFSAKSRDELIFRRDIDDICERSPDTFAASYFVTGNNATRLPDGYSQIFRSYVFGPSGLWTMAPATLRCKI